MKTTGLEAMQQRLAQGRGKISEIARASRSNKTALSKNPKARFAVKGAKGNATPMQRLGGIRRAGRADWDHELSGNWDRGN